MEGTGNSILYNLIGDSNDKKNDTKVTIDLTRSLHIINQSDTKSLADLKELRNKKVEVTLKETDKIYNEEAEQIDLSKERLFFVSAKAAYIAKAIGNNVDTEEERRWLANHKDEIRMIKTFSLAISLLTLCVMITIFVSWYTYKRKELGIFVISGCSWKTAILLSVLPYYFSIIIGGLSGFSGWALYEKYWKTEFNVIRWKTFLMLIVVYIIIYSIGVLIYYLMYRRSSPVSLYRQL